MNAVTAALKAARIKPAQEPKPAMSADTANEFRRAVTTAAHSFALPSGDHMRAGEAVADACRRLAEMCGDPEDAEFARTVAKEWEALSKAARAHIKRCDIAASNARELLSTVNEAIALAACDGDELGEPELYLCATLARKGIVINQHAWRRIIESGKCEPFGKFIAGKHDESTARHRSELVRMRNELFPGGSSESRW